MFMMNKRPDDTAFAEENETDNDTVCEEDEAG